MDKDPVAAVVAFLKTVGLSTDRIFGTRLPRGEAEHMPRAAVLVRGAGGAGAFQHGYMPEIDDRVDVRCYAATPWEARALGGETSRALFAVRDVHTDHGRIVWCRRAGGVSDVTEPNTTWPLTLSSWQVYGDWLGS